MVQQITVSSSCVLCVCILYTVQSVTSCTPGKKNLSNTNCLYLCSIRLLFMFDFQCILFCHSVKKKATSRLSKILLPWVSMTLVGIYRPTQNIRKKKRGRAFRIGIPDDMRVEIQRNRRKKISLHHSVNQKIAALILFL